MPDGWTLPTVGNVDERNKQALAHCWQAELLGKICGQEHRHDEPVSGKRDPQHLVEPLYRLLIDKEIVDFIEEKISIVDDLYGKSVIMSEQPPGGLS